MTYSLTPIKIDTIDTKTGTQYRVETDPSVVEDMEDLIERGITFKTPMKIALFEGHYYLVDGFHRYAAYMNKQVPEVPAGQWECIECSSLKEVHLLAMKANVTHGKNNTQKDYRNIIESMMDSDPDLYMKNAFEPDIKAISEALGAPATRVKAGYSSYFGTTENPQPSLYQICKKNRDRAIYKEHLAGESAGSIAKKFGIPNKNTVIKSIQERTGLYKEVANFFIYSATLSAEIFTISKISSLLEERMAIDNTHKSSRSVNRIQDVKASERDYKNVIIDALRVAENYEDSKLKDAGLSSSQMAALSDLTTSIASYEDDETLYNYLLGVIKEIAHEHIRNPEKLGLMLKNIHKKL